MRYFLVVILLNFMFFDFIQGQKIETLVKEYIENENSQIDNLLLNDSSNLIEKILDETKTYYNDNNENVRYRSYSLAYRSLGETRKQERLSLLLNIFCRDESYTIRDYYGRRLYEYSYSIYNKENVKALREILYHDDWVTPQVILIAGYLNLEEDRNRLKSFKEGKNTRSFSLKLNNQWASHLALARMGEMEYLDSVMNRIYNSSDWDNLIKNMKYLSYVQQDKATDFIVQLLMSEKRLPPVHKGKGELYAYRPSKTLASLLQGAPQKIYIRGKNQKQPDYIQTMRQWIKTKNNKWQYNKGNFW